MDKYSNFNELREVELEGQDFQIHVETRPAARTVIVAPHGGAIEAGTSELTIAIAGSDLNYACFDGLKASSNRDLHITSSNFDVPSIVELVRSADYVLALHGEHSNCDIVFLGGSDTALGKELERSLTHAEFTVQRHTNPKLQGQSPGNICNRGNRHMGVQLELGSGLRSTLFSSLNAAGRKRTTSRFNNFVGAVRNGLANGEAL